MVFNGKPRSSFPDVRAINGGLMLLAGYLVPGAGYPVPGP